MKTILLLSNKQDLLQKLTKITKVPEMIVSALFLITGVYLMTQLPEIKAITWIKVVLVLASIPLAIVGFKKGNKILAALSLLLITASYGLGEVSKKKREKGEAVASTVNSGSELYSLKCASCHGADGKAGLSGATDLSKTMMDAAAIKQTVINGKATMPKVEMSEEQALAVAAYVEANIKGK
jgi:cytochrome c5